MGRMTRSNTSSCFEKGFHNPIKHNDALLEINTEDQSKDLEVEINIDEDVSFIDEDEINEDDNLNEEIIDDKK